MRCKAYNQGFDYLGIQVAITGHSDKISTSVLLFVVPFRKYWLTCFNNLSCAAVIISKDISNLSLRLLMIVSMCLPESQVLPS